MVFMVCYRNIRMLHTMSSGIPLTLDLGTRWSDPYVYVAFGLLHEAPLACESAESGSDPKVGHNLGVPFKVSVHTP